MPAIKLPCKRINSILLLAIGLPVLFAQTPRVETLTIANGLSQGMIYDIEQSDDGFLWFATKDGLNRFDGYRFEVFTNDPFNPFSIAGNEIHHLFEDSRGNLWISIFGKGLDVLEKNSGRFLHLPMGYNQDGLPMSVSVTETSDGTIWVGNADGLFRLRWHEAGMVQVKSSPGVRDYMSVEQVEWEAATPPVISELIAQPDGSLLLSLMKEGIFRYVPSTGQRTLLMPGNQMNAAFPIQESARGRVWTGKGGNDLYLIESGSSPRRMAFHEFPDTYNIGRILSDGRGNLLWNITSALHGSYFFTAPEEELAQKGSGNPKEIFRFDMYSPWSEVDHSGNLWIGTSGYGLRKINLAPLPFRHLQGGKSIRKIIISSKVYFSGALSQYGWLDEANDRFFAYPTELPGNIQVFSFLHAKNGNAYFLGYNDTGAIFGIKRASGIEWLPLNPISDFPPLMEDSRGVIWAGGMGYLACYVPSANQIFYLNLADKLGAAAEVYAIHEDVNRNLWAGTTNGILRLTMENVPLTDFQSALNRLPFTVYQTDPSNPGSLRHNFVTSFCDDPLEPRRFLWVSTKGGGLNRLDMTTGKFRHFTSQNSGLPNDVVYGILPDDQGNLWGSTNRGLFRATPLPSTEDVPTDSPSEEGRSGRLIFRNFREFDGLQGDEFNTASFAKGKDGRLYFGGVNGLTVFDPKEIVDRKSDAQVRITSLKINNLPVDYFQKNSPLDRPIYRTDHIRLNHTQNLVTLEFALLDFVNPQENRFRYRLLGVDPDWVEAGTDHSANYANLRAGSYLFEVQGSISGGGWSAPATLKITVLPPWWASWWAYTLYALACATAAIAFYKIRVRQKLEHQEALRLRELDEFKSRFFTNITHEFRTPLTVILGTSEQLATGSEKWAIPKEKQVVKNRLALIKRNGENLLRLINQILDLAKLESNSLKINYVQADILPYLRYIAESLQSLANAQNVLLRVESNETSIVMDHDPERLLQIVHNLLSNAIKFTPSGGKVTLRANFRNSTGSAKLELTVRDTGVGIPPEEQPKVFDRFFQANTPVSTAWRAGGTGIGLSLTKELVKAMSGEIAVESEAGKGSTFTVLLPITNKAALGKVLTSTDGLVSPALPEHPGGSLKAPQELSAAGLERPSLLLIEDNPDVVEYLAACLGENYDLDFAYNGRSGIEKALETIPDLLISDVMMPEKDGFEVCDFLKNDERTSHIPIVLLTAKADVESRILGLKRGADAYLAKPFHQEELLATLTNLLELRKKIQAKFADLRSLNADSTIPSPVAAHPSPIADIEDAFLNKLRLCIEENMGDTTFDGGQLAKAMNLSEVQLYRKIKALTDKSTAIYIRSVRLLKGRELLLNSTMNVSEIAYEVGFDDPNYFSRTFSQEFGVAPSELRKSR